MTSDIFLFPRSIGMLQQIPILLSAHERKDNKKSACLSCWTLIFSSCVQIEMQKILGKHHTKPQNI